MKAMVRCAKCLALLLVAALWLAGQRPDFASFEQEAEVARWKAAGAAEAAQSRSFPSWEAHSLRVVVPAGAAGGVETSYLPRDWGDFEALQFFVYAEQPATLSVEVQDAAGAIASQQTGLRRGGNHVQLRTARFAGADLSRVAKLALHVAPPDRAVTLYLDRFRLAEYNEVLARDGRMDAPYSAEIETPHFPWARPFVNGPLRVLIVPDVAHGRAAIELAQRLQCELFPVTLGARSGTNRWGFGDYYGQRGTSYVAPFSLAYTYLADNLLNGPDYDVMVLPGTRPWEEFPEVVRSAIRRRVEQGMGLVLIDMDAGEGLSPLVPAGSGQQPGAWRAAGAHYISRNVPLRAFPFDQLRHRVMRATGEPVMVAESGAPVLAVQELGKGRVVAAAWRQRGLIPLVEDQWSAEATWRYWEYMYSLLARSIVWAARKEPAAGIARIEFDRGQDPRLARVHLSGRPAPGRKLAVWVRDEHWAEEETRTIELDPARPVVELQLPAEPRGRLHFVDVLLKNAADEVIDWGSATYQRTLPAAIAAIEFSADRFPAGAAVTGQVGLEGTLEAGSQLRLRLYDNYERLLDEKTVEPSAGENRFTLSSRGCLTRLASVQADLVVHGRLRQRKRRDVFILRPKKWDHYDVVMYLFGSDPAPGLWDTIQQRLKEMYVTTLSSYPLALSKHANFGVQAQTRISGQESPDGEARKPYLARKNDYFRTRDKKYLSRIYCLNDPAYRELQRKEIEEKVIPWVPFSPMSYYIYEEPSLTCYDDAMDLCFSRFCMAKMREWLKTEYGDLEALNRQWGTRFTNWDEVIPDTTEEAQRRGNYSSWADHRTFMELTYAENYAYVKQLLRRHDPDGRVLLSGTQSSAPHNGCDYSRLDLILDHLNPYNHEGQIEFHRSFNPQLRLSGGAGYGVHGRDVLYNFYRNLFHGYWAGSYVFWQYSILNPDYRFNGSARDIREGYREIIDGAVDSLIRGATRENNGIAIHYSYPSIHGAWIVDGSTFPPVGRGPNDLGTNWGPTGEKFRASRDGWTSVLEDLGLQFDYVARQQIEAGELVARKFRVLVLPFSVAISRREADEIRRFVEAGGTVIADGHAGVMDGHAGWLPRGSLDDLFGIRRAAPAREKELASAQPESTLELAGAAALDKLDGVPVVLRNRYGAGKAIYLNFFLTTYLKERRAGTAGRRRRLVGRALEEAGVTSAYKVLTAGDRPLEGFELVPYRAGSAVLLGLLKENAPQVVTEPIRILLGGPYEVYDVRAKKHLGRLSVITDSIRTAEPKFYALLPRPVRSVEITATAEPRRGQPFVYEVTVDAGAGVETALRVWVYRPGEALAREYSTTLRTQSGKATGSFPLALNDPAGRWRIVAREAISGQEATLSFQFRGQATKSPNLKAVEDTGAAN